MAEDLTDYLQELGVKVQYLHSEVDTLERVAILRDLRLGVFDVLVGINLLREGIDLPEVTLVAILDADKEGFLRSSWSLIQMIGRAARNIGGKVVMYADTTTESMAAAIEETNRRRAIQAAYNIEQGIEPTTIVKEIHDINERLRTVAETTPMYRSEREDLAGRALTLENTAAIEKLVGRMETEMRAAAKQLDFERAAALRDEIQNDPPARPRAGPVADRRPGRGAGGVLARRRADRRRRPEARGPGRRGDGRSSRRSRSRASRSSPPKRSRPTRSTRTPRRRHADGDGRTDPNTASDWLPGIRDEHEDEGRGAAWRDRPAWDRSVTPNIRRRTGTRPARRR